ncbi:endoribonuclease ZC3H12A [Gracilinanus agilis]|uniref:endoribonuclease ZC3H12A n=1 Tax=Gracilinanus agilis TaxID=191870 RepID=UPI001CFE389B|nr:endoribonuclease ZC3H12A [Gracilinanus agilis]
MNMDSRGLMALTPQSEGPAQQTGPAMSLSTVQENSSPGPTSLAPHPRGQGSPQTSRSGSPHNRTAPELGQPEVVDDTELQMKVDFFRKLGYSSGEIHGVLHKLGLQADTNTVLGELVKHGPATERETPLDGPPEPPLVPRGGGTPKAPSPCSLPAEDKEVSNLRPVVIDGSNVAMSHGNKEVFSCRGILLAVNWFLERGHSDITVFVPLWRKEQPRPDVPITDQHILRELEKKKILVFTPSRRVGGKRVVCYDDRFIVKLAFESNGIIVSNDTYRDLQSERLEWKRFIEERLLMYSFVNDKFMPPDDPLGRHGPSLDNFLRKKPLVLEHKKQPCPYGKKCTYGIKCRFYHPERPSRPQRSVADELRANARLSPPRAPAKDQKCRQPSPTSTPAPGSLPLKDDRECWLPEKFPGPQQASGGSGDGPPKAYAQGRSLPTMSGGFGPADWGPPPLDSLSYLSQDCLDSGIGSLESQMSDLWGGRGSSHGESGEPSRTGGSGSNPQRCAFLGRVPPLTYGPEPPAGPSSLSFSGYGRPVGTGQFSIPAEYPPPLGYVPREYWSEPYPMPPPTATRAPPALRDPHLLSAPEAYGAEAAAWGAGSDSFTKQRASLRVKLCGIFPPHLVEAVMRRFPQLLDPLQLAAEILNYKSQNPSG